MIYEMFGDIRDRMVARKFPVHFDYGPERCAREGHHFGGLIVIERDRDQSDEVQTVVGSHRNPRRKAVRQLAVKATIFANSTIPGAHIGDHERECEALVDALLVELEDWGTESKAGHLPILEARYLSASDRDDIESWPGVVYVVRFRVSRGVNRVDYNGAGQPTGEATSVGNVIKVRRTGADPATAETVPVP